MIEREIKLSFATVEDARRAVLAAGATPLRCRRLQEDALLDTPKEKLRRRRCVLRITEEWLAPSACAMCPLRSADRWDLRACLLCISAEAACRV